MIAEELVASGGARVQEADIPKEPPRAAAASKLRVSVFPCGPMPFCTRTQRVLYRNSADAQIC